MSSPQKLSTLTLRAAISVPHQARDAWHQLLSVVGFEDLPNSVVRFLPRIYLNLRSVQGVEEFERIRGAYKLNWAKNSALSYEALKVFRELKKDGRRFLVLKGFAVGLATGGLNSRVMGDVDVVVNRSELRPTQNALSQLGYVLRDANSPLGLQGLGAYENPNGAVVDLHRADQMPPWSRVMKSEPIELDLDGVGIPVPQFEDLVAHSLGHGLQKNAESDLMQSVLDYLDMQKVFESGELPINFARLAPFFNLTELSEVVSAVSEHSPNVFDVDVGRRNPILPLDRLVPLVKERLRKLFLLPRLLFHRRLNLREVRRLSRQCWAHPRLTLYAFWLAFGQFKALERIFAKRGWGLAHPRELFLNGGPCPERDYRFVISRGDADAESISVRINAVLKSETNLVSARERSVSINGYQYGFFPTGGSLEARYAAPPGTGDFEVALSNSHRFPAIGFEKVTGKVVRIFGESTPQVRP